MYSPNWIDIVIVNYHGSADIEKCLEALGHWPHGTVWLIDNSDCAAQANFLKDLAQDRPWVKLLVAASNLGFGRACNWAFSKSVAEYCLLLNPDARIERDAIVLLAQHLAERPKVAGASPRTYWNRRRKFLLPPAYPLTPWNQFVDIASTWSDWLAKRLALRYLNTVRRITRRTHSAVPFLAGGILLIRRSAIDYIGGLFNPVYFMFFEDADLCKRLTQAGFELHILADSSAIHEYRHKASKAALMHASRQQYLRLFHPRWSVNFDRLQHFARPVDVSKRFNVATQPLHNLRSFSDFTQARPVELITPSVVARPCLFTATADEAAPLDESDWALLEPGHYIALLAATPRYGRSWIFFTKAQDSEAIGFSTHPESQRT